MWVSISMNSNFILLVAGARKHGVIFDLFLFSHLTSCPLRNPVILLSKYIKNYIASLYFHYSTLWSWSPASCLNYCPNFRNWIILHPLSTVLDAQEQSTGWSYLKCKSNYVSLLLKTCRFPTTVRLHIWLHFLCDFILSLTLYFSLSFIYHYIASCIFCFPFLFHSSLPPYNVNAVRAEYFVFFIHCCISRIY